MTIGDRSFDLRLADFCPFNTWSEPIKIHPNRVTSDIEWVADSRTNRLFWNESKFIVWIKMVGFSCLITPIFHTGALIYGIVKKIFNLCTGYRYEEGRQFTAKAVGKDILWIVATPLMLAGLELAAVYGLITPWNGRKLYGNLERAIFGEGFFCCMAPNDKYYYSDPSAQIDPNNSDPKYVNPQLKLYSK